MAEREYSVNNLRQLVKAQLVETIKEMEEAMLQLRYRELNKALPPNSHVEPGEHEAVTSGVQPHMEPGQDEKFALDPIGNNPIGHSQQPVGSGTGLPMNGLPSADMCPMCGNGDEPGSCQCLGKAEDKTEGKKPCEHAIKVRGAMVCSNRLYPCKGSPDMPPAPAEKAEAVDPRNNQPPSKANELARHNATIEKSGQPSFQQIRPGSTSKPAPKPLNPMTKSVPVHTGASDHWGKDNADVMAKAGTIHDAGSVGGAGDKTSVDNPDTMAKAATTIATTGVNDNTEARLVSAVGNVKDKIKNAFKKDGSDLMDGMGPQGSGPGTVGAPGADMAMSEDVKKAELLKEFGFKKSEHCKKCGNLQKMCKCMSKKSPFAKSAKQEMAARKAESAGDRINAVDESKGSDHEERLEPTKGAGTLPQDKVAERVKSGNDQDVPLEGEHTHTVKGEELDKGRIHGAPVQSSGTKGYGPGMFPGSTQKAEELDKMAGRIHGAPVQAAGKGYGPGHFPSAAPAAAPMAAPGLKAPPASVKPNKVSIRPVAKPAAIAPAAPAAGAPAMKAEKKDAGAGAGVKVKTASPNAAYGQPALKAEMAVPTAKPPKAVVGGMPKAPKAAGMGTMKNEGGKALAMKLAGQGATAKSEGGKALAMKLAGQGATAKSEGGKALAMKLAGAGAAKKSEPLAKPSVSQAQNRAMHAAASGNSTLDIPKSVGKDFVSADHGKKVGSLPEHKKAEPELSPGTPKSSEQHGAAPKAGVDVGGMPGSTDPGTGVRKGLKLPHQGGVMVKGMGMGQMGGSAVPGMNAGAPTQGNGMALTQHEPGEHEGEKNKFAADKRTASADPSIAGKNPEASDYDPKDYSGFIGKDEEKLDSWAKGKK